MEKEEEERQKLDAVEAQLKAERRAATLERANKVRGGGGGPYFRGAGHGPLF